MNDLQAFAIGTPVAFKILDVHREGEIYDILQGEKSVKFEIQYTKTSGRFGFIIREPEEVEPLREARLKFL